MGDSTPHLPFADLGAHQIPLPPIPPAETDDLALFANEMQAFLADLYSNIDQHQFNSFKDSVNRLIHLATLSFQGELHVSEIMITFHNNNAQHPSSSGPYNVGHDSHFMQNLDARFILYKLFADPSYTRIQVDIAICTKQVFPDVAPHLSVFVPHQMIYKFSLEFDRQANLLYNPNIQYTGIVYDYLRSPLIIGNWQTTRLSGLLHQDASTVTVVSHPLLYHYLVNGSGKILLKLIVSLIQVFMI